MLQIRDKRIAYAEAAAVGPADGRGEMDGSDLAGLVIFLRRNIRTAALYALVCAALGAAYLLVITPSFTARTTLLMDVRKPRTVQDQSAIQRSTSELGYVESQVEVLQSAPTIERTVVRLRLTDDPEFGREDGLRAIISKLCPSVSWFPCPNLPPDDEQAKIQNATEHVRQNLFVQRLGQSQVIALDFTAKDRDRAAEIANALVQSYIDAEAAAANRLTREAISWLEQQIESLRRQALAADSKLQEFKAGVTGPADGRQRDFIMRELISASENQQALYKSFVQRYAETAQQLSYPFSDARILTIATPPMRRAGPGTITILAVAAISGLILSLGVSTVREKLDRTIRTPEAFEVATGLPCLAAIPAGKTTKFRSPRADADGARPRGNRICAGGPEADVLRETVLAPMTAFSRKIGLLLAKLEARLHDTSATVIGIMPAGDGVQHAVIAANLAGLAAQLGRSTLLIDGDSGRATLTARLAPDAPLSGSEIRLARQKIDGVVYRDEATHLAFLPNRIEAGQEGAPPATCPDWIAFVVTEARQTFSLVVVVLPECLESGDMHHALDSLDELILVGEAGTVRPDQIQKRLREIRGHEDRLTGLILSEVAG
jgi:uncharacterized protein involved in exopolysaccharide biosynthesis